VLPHETAEYLQANPGLPNEFLSGEKPGDWIYLFDREKYSSEVFQRPYLYLSQLRDPTKAQLLDDCCYGEQPHDYSFLLDCLKTLLDNFCVKQPTWMELTHFASFLNAQLRSSETSVFCNSEVMAADFPGMKSFVVQFLIQMSKDFASRSVDISDQSQGDGFSRPVIEERHRWENSPHPYIFFNEDGHSMSFFGFRLDGQRNLLDERTNKVLVPRIMTRELYQGLVNNRVPFNEPFEQKTLDAKLEEISRVFGIHGGVENPDLTYELTTDNVMKMLAIYMRFRSNIPVVSGPQANCSKPPSLCGCSLNLLGRAAHRQ
jgi:hypothetical protein